MSVYRNRKLLDLAHKLNTCPLCGKYSLEGLEPMHSNQGKHGKGMGMKAGDHFHGAGCHECHMIIDQGPISREQKQDMWQMAFDKTFTEYFERGWLTVTGSK